MLVDDNGLQVSDQDSLLDMVEDYYKNLFTSQPPSMNNAGLLQYILTLVNANDNDRLVAPPLIEEIKDAVFSLCPDSAPGPDGFSGDFFTICWDIISKDVSDAVIEFFNVVLFLKLLLPLILYSFLRRILQLRFKISDLLAFAILITRSYLLFFAKGLVISFLTLFLLFKELLLKGETSLTIFA